MKRSTALLAVLASTLVLLSAPQANAITPVVNLGAAQSFLVIGSAGVTSSGATVISGDVGVGPNAALVGFPPARVGGLIHQSDSVAAQARKDVASAYTSAAHLLPTDTFAGDPNARTFGPGVHRINSALSGTGVVTLDARGDPSASFVFQIDGALDAAASSTVKLANGASAANVFWQVNGAATIGATSKFVGTILAAAAITVGEGSVLVGRALTQAAVTLANNTFTDTSAPVITIAGGGNAFTIDPTPVLSGTVSTTAAQPLGSTTPVTITVSIAGQVLSTTLIGESGSWTLTPTALPPGTYRVVASVTDRQGNKGSALQILNLRNATGGVNLGATSNFTVLGGGGVTSTGLTVIKGELGSSPSPSIVGFPPGVVVLGSIHPGDPAAAQARADFDLAYLDAKSRVPTRMFAGDQNGATFFPGTYHSEGAFELTGTLTLDAKGDPNAVFLFTINAALNTAASSKILLIHGAQASHVFWQANGAAGTGADSSFSGTILADGAITIGAGGSLLGRALASGLITLASNNIVNPGPFTDATVGFLSISQPTSEVSLGTVADSASGTMLDGQLGQVEVIDDRHASGVSSWVATATSTPFMPAAGGPTVPAQNVTYSSGPVTIDSPAVFGPVPLQDLSGAAVVVNVSGIIRDSKASWYPTLHIFVPSGTPPGAYAATITHSVG